MLIIGLTGSLAMGKSTASARLESSGIPVFDADAAVHDLYDGPAAQLIEDAFPDSVRNGRVDRQRLTRALAGKPENFEKLEAIVHPLVLEAEKDFLQTQKKNGARLAVLEIPLLFETGTDALVDVTLVVTTTPEIWKKRASERPGMTDEKFKAITARQMPDADKRKKADFILDTSGPKDQTARALDKIVESLKTRKGSAYERWQNL